MSLLLLLLCSNMWYVICSHEAYVGWWVYLAELLMMPIFQWCSTALGKTHFLASLSVPAFTMGLNQMLNEKQKISNINILPSDFDGFQNSCSWLRYLWHWYNIITDSNVNVEWHLLTRHFSMHSSCLINIRMHRQLYEVSIYYSEIMYFGTSLLIVFIGEQAQHNVQIIQIGMHCQERILTNILQKELGFLFVCWSASYAMNWCSELAVSNNILFILRMDLCYCHEEKKKAKYNASMHSKGYFS